MMRIIQVSICSFLMYQHLKHSLTQVSTKNHVISTISTFISTSRLALTQVSTISTSFSDHDIYLYMRGRMPLFTQIRDDDSASQFMNPPENIQDMARRIFDGIPITPGDPFWYDLWINAPVEVRPCEAGLISETTVCERCRYECKVKS